MTYNGLPSCIIPSGFAMLTLHDGAPGYNNIAVDTNASTLPSHVTWIDLFNGTPEEIEFVERATKRRVPSLADLNEIESSSRLRFEHGAFYLSATVISRIPTEEPKATPVGFILTKDYLITVRFDELTAFETFRDDYAENDSSLGGGSGVFAGLVGAVVDRAADVLEGVGADLDKLSGNVLFGRRKAGMAPRRDAENLRETLRKIGYNGHLASKIRGSLLGIGRVVSYVAGSGMYWIPADMKAALETQHRDILSLSDYELHLTNEVQMLLDATMGQINIEQNNIIKVLTVVSVVGVPPTLIAGIYGMNFHFMPELDWSLGYAFGWAMILLSAVVPVLWFKKRGWL